jgi:potassium-transporting ATPase KdpC subunit
MKKLICALKPAILYFIIMTVLCGVIYTGIVTGIAQLFFPVNANGSIITVISKDGSTVEYGSVFIAQEFTKAKYLIGRPMGTSNLSAVSDGEKKLVQDRIKWLHYLDPENDKDIPVELVTASGSGADPYISAEAAEYQVVRIAVARGISENSIREIIKKYTKEKFLGIWGEEGVNVLEVNLALDGLLKSD